jgi:glycyl-tRNA synthetase beta subunit
VENLIANKESFDLREGVRAAAGLLPVQSDANTEAQVLDFIAGRLESLFREQGLPANEVRAVLAEQAHDPYTASLAVRQLVEATARDDWELLLDAYARCVRITRDNVEQYTLRPQALREDAEKELLAALVDAQGGRDGTVATLVSSLEELQPAISRFFDEVLVMDDDESVRHNRLALLQSVTALASGIADLSHLEGF